MEIYKAKEIKLNKNIEDNNNVSEDNSEIAEPFIKKTEDSKEDVAEESLTPKERRRKALKKHLSIIF